LGLCLLGLSTSYLFGNQFFRFDMQKESSKIFIVLTPGWSNIIIFQSLSDIVVFFFPMWSLTCLVWICTVTIQKNIFNLSKCWLFVQFRANFKRLKTTLRHLGVKTYNKQWKLVWSHCHNVNDNELKRGSKVVCSKSA